MRILLRHNGVLLSLFLISFMVFNTISHKLYACGGGGSSPDGITLKLQGVDDLAKAIKLKAALQKNEAIKCANVSPDKTVICISILCPGAITEEEIVKTIEERGNTKVKRDLMVLKTL